MSTTNDGGLAFPTLDRSFVDRRDDNTVYETSGGMTLRAYFAAKADIPWEVAADVVYRQNGNANGTLTQIMAKRAQLRFEQADAMIAAGAA